MADAEGLQALQRTPEIPVHLFKAQQGVRADGNALSLPAQPILRQGVEPFLEWMHLLRRHGEATGCRMTSETFQQVTAAVQGGIHGKSGWCPHGGPQAAIPLSRQQGGRPVMDDGGPARLRARMKELAVPLAGEANGHIFFADRWYGFSDALYAAARLLEVLSLQAGNSAEAFAPYTDTF